MTPPARKYDELYVLLDDLCDGALSAESAARLDALLRRTGRPAGSICSICRFTPTSA